MLHVNVSDDDADDDESCMDMDNVHITLYALSDPLKYTYVIGSRLIPYRIEDFQRQSQIGRGRSGLVNSALHVPTNVVFAHKHLSLFDDAAYCSAVNEIQLLLRAKHDHVVKVVAVLRDDMSSHAGGLSNCNNRGIMPGTNDTISDHPTPLPKLNHITLVMEHMDLGNVNDYLRRRSHYSSVGVHGPFKSKTPKIHAPLSERNIAFIARQVIKAVEFIHAQNITHRDIKPANVLFNTNGVIKLADFGIGRDGRDHAFHSTFVGTFSYMSPERLTGGNYTSSSDVWAIGLMMYEWACGCYPLLSPNRLTSTVNSTPVSRLHSFESPSSITNASPSGLGVGTLMDFLLPAPPKSFERAFTVPLSSATTSNSSVLSMCRSDSGTSISSSSYLSTASPSTPRLYSPVRLAPLAMDESNGSPSSSSSSFMQEGIITTPTSRNPNATTTSTTSSSFISDNSSEQRPNTITLSLPPSISHPSISREVSAPVCPVLRSSKSLTLFDVLHFVQDGANLSVLSEEYSPEFRLFLQQCLDANPSARPSATELLSHPFLRKHCNMADAKQDQEELARWIAAASLHVPTHIQSPTSIPPSLSSVVRFYDNDVTIVAPAHAIANNNSMRKHPRHETRRPSIETDTHNHTNAKRSCTDNTPHSSVPTVGYDQKS